MAFPSDYEDSVHRFVYEPNEKSLEADEKNLEASPVSPTRDTKANEGITLTHFPSKAAAHHVENDDKATSEANQSSTAQVNSLEASESAMDPKDHAIGTDDKAFEANAGDGDANSRANNRDTDGRTNGGVTTALAGGALGQGNRGLGSDDKALEAGHGNPGAGPIGRKGDDGGFPSNRGETHGSSPTTSGGYRGSDDGKGVAQYISHSDALDHAGTDRRRRREAPPLVRDLGHEERARLERALVRKIDLRLLPMIILMYILNYLDRNNIASARLAGLETDLGLVGTQYQTCVSILFVGYLLMQVPSNLFLNKIGKPALYLPTVMIIWGMISALTAACQTFGGLLAVRFFLGFVEAAYFPGCLFFLSSWYTRKELGLRTAMLFSGSLISGAFSGLIAAGIVNGLDGRNNMRAWRWLFIIEGTVTIFVALFAFFLLPNFPRTTSWLTEEERQLAVWRLDEDIGQDDWLGSKEQDFFHGAKLAVRDVKMWILMLMLLGIVSSGSVTNFFPTVVATLGYGRIDSLLLTAPPYVLAVATSLANAWHADRSGERYWHVVLPLGVGVGAFVLAAATTATAPRYVAMMLMVPGVYTGYVVILAWISNSIPRPPAKRAASLAAINAVSNASSIYASYLYPTSDGPRYRVAFVVDCVTAFVAICAATGLRFILVRLNERLDRGEYVEGAIMEEEGVPGEAAKKGFRFLT